MQSLFDVPTTADFPLRPYQHDAIAAMAQAEQDGITRQLVVMPTGAGKTVVFAAKVKQTPGRSLIIVHRDELVRQTLDKLRMVAPGIQPGVIQGPRNDTEHRVIVASIQTLSGARRLPQLRSDFNLVIVDEAHHAPADTYQAVLQHLGSFQRPTVITAGFTATPERGDGVTLGQTWQKIVYRKELLEMIAERHLCNVRGQTIDLGIDFDKVQRNRGDYSDGSLAALMTAHAVPEQLARAYQMRAMGRRALVFCPTVAFAEETAEAFTLLSLKAAVVTGETPPEQRQLIYSQLRRGAIHALVGCMVFTEGFDEPSIDCIILGRPTSSRPLYVQMVGRGLRNSPGKEDCLVLDCVGVAYKYKLETLATLTGLDPSELAKDKSVLEVLQEQAEQAKLGPTVLTGATPKLVSIDLFTQAALRWLKLSSGGYSISVPGGDLYLQEQADGHYRVLQRFDRVKGVSWRERYPEPKLLAADLTLEYAQGRAESIIRENKWDRLVDKTRGWNADPATSAQQAAMARMGIAFNPDTITKGEASGLMDRFFAERRR